jgi:hypothetical protein
MDGHRPPLADTEPGLQVYLTLLNPLQFPG